MGKPIKNLKNYNNKSYEVWKNKWIKRVKLFNNSLDKSIELMKLNNPMIIPRNHKIEEALLLAENGELSLFNRLLEMLKKPYYVNNIDLEFMSPNLNINENYKTFCGT